MYAAFSRTVPFVGVQGRARTVDPDGELGAVPHGAVLANGALRSPAQVSELRVRRCAAGGVSELMARCCTLLQYRPADRAVDLLVGELGRR